MRIPGTTFSDYTPKTDWKKLFYKQHKEIDVLCKSLCAVCERLNNDSAWADESEEFYEMCKLEKHAHPATAAEDVNKNILQSLQTCLRVVLKKNEPEYEVILSELAEALDLNPLGTKCKCGNDLSLSLSEVTGCGGCDLQ